LHQGSLDAWRLRSSHRPCEGGCCRPIPPVSVVFHADVFVRSFRSGNVVVRGAAGEGIAPFLTPDVQSSVGTSTLASPPESPV
jgi:hypothetical protein